MPNRGFLLLFLLLAGCGPPPTSLVDELDRARTSASEGVYPSFLDAPSARGLVRIAEDSRPSLTPPFPAELRFDLTLPDAAVLSFATAIVARTEVRRAGVEFQIRLDADGESALVFDESFDFDDANRWHDREVSLAAWSRRPVKLSLRTTAAVGGTGKLWADRIQTVWGNPVIESNPSAVLAASQREDAQRAIRFSIDLVVGGILGLVVRWLYLRFASVGADRSSFASLFPLFTLSTILVVTVVQVSIPLSLGLLGALSIVRFRSAIKTPEDLTYLLFCVAIGVALAGGHRLLAAATAALVAMFLALHRWLQGTATEKSVLLSLSGEAARFVGTGSVLLQLRSEVERLEIQRLDRDGERIELRTVVTVRGVPLEKLLGRLRETFPGLEIAGVDSDAVL
jgi:hypothetical protein